mgnify:CR=1 FL=1
MIKEAIGLGETIVLAKESACKILGVKEKDVDFEVLQMPSKKTLGIFGGKPAKVKAFFEVSPTEVAHNYLKEILMNMGLRNFKIDIEEVQDGAMLKVSGDRVNVAIGKRGDVLNALQYLVSLAANAASDNFFHLTINIEDYRERRFKTLESLGRSLAFKAIKTQQVQALEPMSPYERWIIHLAVKEIRGAKSWSAGEDANRHVLVGPSEDFISEKRQFNNRPFKTGFETKFNHEKNFNRYANPNNKETRVAFNDKLEN